MLKVVIDANVFVSALLSDGTPRRIIEQLERDRFELFYSAQLISELYKTRTKKKLAERIQPDRLAALIDLIQNKGELIDVQISPPVVRDPEDDEYVECALKSASEFIVTGDDDLLSIGEFKAVRIVTPRQFLDFLESGGSPDV